ncbi:hypothetical protein ACN6K4_001222 [Streptomyces hayashii]
MPLRTRPEGPGHSWFTAYGATPDRAAGEDAARPEMSSTCW